MAVKAIIKENAAETEIGSVSRRGIGKYRIFIITYSAVIVAINIIAILSKSFCDFYLDHVFYAAAATLGRFSGMFPFSLGEVLITLAIMLVLLSVILSILLIFMHRRERYRRFTARFLKSMLVIALSVVLVYTLNCSMLYCSTMLSFADGVREFDVEEFEEVRSEVVEECNALALRMERADDGTMIFHDNADTAAATALRGISERFPRLKGYYPPAKKMLGSYFMYKSQIIGVYFPFSMEANYSKYVSDSYLPHVTAHEYAHLKGYIYESEANFMSFLGCINSDDDAVKYSGYLCVLSYIDNDYKNAVAESRYNAQPQISDLVRFDNVCYDNATWEYLKKRDEEKKQPKVAEIAENVSDKMTDAYMDAFYYKPNYSEVTLLMMQYYTEYGSFEIE